MKKALLIAFFCLTLIPTNLFADSEPAWKSMKPFCLPAHSRGGTVIKPGETNIALEFIVRDMDQYYNGTSKTDSHASPVSEASQNFQYLGLRYGIIENMDLRIKIPFISMDYDDEDGNTLAGPNGLGDTAYVFRYQFLNQRKGDPLYLCVGLGGALPTGRDHDTGVGSGATDFYGEITTSYTFKSQRIDAEYMYGYRGNGEFDGDHRKKGNFHRFLFYYGYAPNHYWDFGIEEIAYWMKKDEIVHVKNDNSGGTRIYVGPEVHLKWLRHNSYFVFSVPYLVYKDVNGDQMLADYYYELKFKCKF